ncbi:MAG: ribose 5-phosphate isomerase B [Candidatus Paracaedimonas acanthamoebae]|uniref:Ribose 5-phosphate isomerase B n=1 Tax=Candidatus Paracaedimonas acanthamoebae TaxID=244581 RepID=A0A8J7TUX9_9PROT|nr:ribose 5-phosphate isomerase B [Candidatus Paracaedimonas acanthamoebae]
MIPIFKKIAIASDHAGFPLKKVLIKTLENLNINVFDLGTFTEESADYPDYARQVVSSILTEEVPAGVLICGTGIGMSIAANRHSGIRAAVCNEGTTSARLARAHNNANILCLGERLIGPEAAKDTLLTFITTAFEDEERHRRRLSKII